MHHFFGDSKLLQKKSAAKKFGRFINSVDFMTEVGFGKMMTARRFFFRPEFFLSRFISARIRIINVRYHQLKFLEPEAALNKITFTIMSIIARLLHFTIHFLSLLIPLGCCIGKHLLMAPLNTSIQQFTSILMQSLNPGASRNCQGLSHPAKMNYVQVKACQNNFSWNDEPFTLAETANIMVF